VNRWITYQKERFPVLAHGLLIAAFSFSGVSFSFLLRTDSGFPPAAAFLVAFATAFLLFLQLRIADEFKDFDEDSRYRPYRPVPRGLVTLRELAVVGVIGGIIQLTLALLINPRLGLLLLVVWIYLALMSREFFVRDWIKARPITYLWTHMLILPLADFYATGCDWLAANVPCPDGLAWFLIVSFFNGVVIELGRKIRAPADEEEGVETYSVLYGRRIAVLAWLGALTATAFCAWQAARRIEFAQAALVILGVLLVFCTVLAIRFLHSPQTNRAKMLEHASGIWTLCMYLTLGAIPLLLRLAAESS
jgi:4-hydroxybenzoate polyprenyltransferase